MFLTHCFVPKFILYSDTTDLLAGGVMAIFVKTVIYSAVVDIRLEFNHVECVC